MKGLQKLRAIYNDLFSVPDRHPERKTVQRAVWILGRLKNDKAVDPLMRLFGQSDDPYLKRGILDALFEIGAPAAMDFIMRSLKSEIKKI